MLKYCNSALNLDSSNNKDIDSLAQDSLFELGDRKLIEKKSVASLYQDVPRMSRNLPQHLTPGYSMANLSTDNPSVDTSKFIKDY